LGCKRDDEARQHEEEIDAQVSAINPWLPTCTPDEMVDGQTGVMDEHPQGSQSTHGFQPFQLALSDHP
jgi:hypothetical protein